MTVVYFDPDESHRFTSLSMNKPVGAKPCPKCNNTKPEWDGWEGSYNVYCPKCGNGGRVGKDKQEAIKMWNESK